MKRRTYIKKVYSVMVAAHIANPGAYRIGLSTRLLNDAARREGAFHGSYNAAWDARYSF